MTTATANLILNSVQILCDTATFIALAYFGTIYRNGGPRR